MWKQLGKQFMTIFLCILIGTSVSAAERLRLTNADGDVIQSLESGFVTAGVALEPSELENGAVLIAALYDRENRLVALNYACQDQEGAEDAFLEVSVAIPEHHVGYSLEIMLWDSIESGFPLTNEAVLR